MSNKPDNKTLLRQLRAKLKRERSDDSGGYADNLPSQTGPSHHISKRKIRRIGIDTENRGLISQTKQDYILNERGKMEEVEQEVIYATTLEDGSPANREGIVICQTCGRLSRYSNTIRCEMPGCGKVCHIGLMCGFFSHKFMGWVCKDCYAELGG